MALRLDEVLALLPQAGLSVWRFDQSRDGRWHVTLEQEIAGVLHHPSADGSTPLGAMVDAFAKAGFVIEDDGT